MKDIAKDQFSFNYSYVNATYDNICEVIKGKSILRFDDNIDGNSTSSILQEYYFYRRN